MEESLHEVDFRVPLSGSQLFDMHAYATAEKICAKFPGLEYEVLKESVRIFGSLDDHRYKEWVSYVFTA